MNTFSKSIVTRFAPSPTGHLHVGGYRTAFFAYLYARKHGGKFILRIEDTDKERSKQEYADEILSVFGRIGIAYDEMYVQSEHAPRHREILLQLIESDNAYISEEEAKDGSGIVKQIVRFRNPHKTITFNDLVRGEIVTDTSDLGDFVLAKSLDEPLFHLAVVVDDHDEEVTHVIRAEEHIANTPRQILIHEALDFPVPKYAHLPLVLSPDKSKLSKRKGAVPVIEYLKQSYLPEALLNAICLCGWNPGTEQEIFTREELEEIFDLDKVQKSGAIFNIEKLDWINKKHMERIDDASFAVRAEEYLPDTITSLPHYSLETFSNLAPIIKERIEKFSDITKMAEEGELEYYFERPGYFVESLLWKDEKSIENTAHYLRHINATLESIPEEEFDKTRLKDAIWSYAEEKGRGNVLWPFRYALSGMERSPDPFTLAEILGKHETLARLETAITLTARTQ